ncbi:MAG: hypothetical protein ABI747_04670 [Candidatus Moraniibacteriota bacterium]
MPLITLFIYGFLSAAAALLLQVVATALGGSLTEIAASTGFISLSVLFLFAAALIEEGSKWIFFRQFRVRLGDTLSSPSPFGLGVIFGLGFSLVEIGLIAFSLKTFSILPLAGIIGVHILTSLFYSYYLFRLTPRVLSHTLFLLALTTLLHACYNLFLV